MDIENVKLELDRLISNYDSYAKEAWKLRDSSFLNENLELGYRSEGKAAAYGGIYVALRLLRDKFNV